MPLQSSGRKLLFLPYNTGEETNSFNAPANDIQKDSYSKGQHSEYVWECHFETAVSHWPLKENQLYRAYWLRECQCNAVKFIIKPVLSILPVCCLLWIVIQNKNHIWRIREGLFIGMSTRH